MKPVPAKRRLRLETLEIRALLAADAGSDLAHALAAVKGASAIDADIIAASANSQMLELTGHDTEALIINLDQLPSFVTKLSLSHFSSVTMLGSDPLDILMASDIKSLVAPNLNIKSGAYLHDVGSVELGSAGPMLVLTGDKTDLAVRSLDETTVYSDLNALTVNSESQALSIESWNVNQSIMLGYHPTSVALAGVTSAAVHFQDELPTASVGGGSEPNLPVGGAVDTASTPGPTFIVLDATNKNTPAFIAELRDAERTSAKDSQRLMLQFLNHVAPEAADSVALPANVQVRHANPANVRELEVPQPNAPASIDVVASEQPDAAAETNVPDLRQVLFSDTLTDRSLHVVPSDLLPVTEQTHTVQIDATWPVAMVAERPTQNSQPFVPLGSAPTERLEPKLEDSLRAFTDYVVDRVAAEFSPGQQSLVLLVDPKPTGSATVNKTSALDLFGSTTRTSIATLRQAMS